MSDDGAIPKIEGSLVKLKENTYLSILIEASIIWGIRFLIS